MIDNSNYLKIKDGDYYLMYLTDVGYNKICDFFLDKNLPELSIPKYLAYDTSNICKILGKYYCKNTNTYRYDINTFKKYFPNYKMFLKKSIYASKTAIKIESPIQYYARLKNITKEQYIKKLEIMAYNIVMLETY